MDICLIVKSTDAADENRLRAEVDRLRAEGHEVHPRTTFEAGDAARSAIAAARAGADLIIVAGGDGTINETVNGLHAFRSEGTHDGPLPRLGVVPLGTGNDLAATLEVPEEIEEAIALAVDGTPREVDVAMVGDRCFLNVSTGGFGAEAAEEAPAEFKRALGPLAYVITGARKFAALEASRARFVADEPIFEGRFLLFAVGNARRTGGGNWLTPWAEMDDGLLDLCVVRDLSRMEFFSLLPGLRSGEHLDHPAVLYRRVPRVTVESESELSVNADGEPLSGRHFDYRLAPYRMTLMGR